MSTADKCPFCASPNTRIDYDISREPTNSKQPTYIFVVCENCGACGPSDLGKSGAIEMWNLRRTEMLKPYTTDNEGT